MLTEKHFLLKVQQGTVHLACVQYVVYKPPKNGKNMCFLKSTISVIKHMDMVWLEYDSITIDE